MARPTSFEDFVAKKRTRPEQICSVCGKRKEIYTHLNGEEDKPLCNACNMKLRRESAGAVQVKLLKLCATAIGSVEAMLGLPVEEKEKKALEDMQDELKSMVCAWLGDPHAEDNAASPAAVADGVQTGTDQFAEERTHAVSEASDAVFEAPGAAASDRKERKTRKGTGRRDEHEAADRAAYLSDTASLAPKTHFKRGEEAVAA